MKPRSDSKLKTLPTEVQAKVYALLAKVSYQKAVGLIAKEHGIATSVGALSAFYSWYPLSRRIEQSRSFADELKKTLASNSQLDLNAEKLSQVAQAAFEIQAVQEQDTGLFVSLRKLRQKDLDLAQQAQNTNLRLKQYEDKMSAMRANLEKAKSKGGLDQSTLELIEQQLKLL
jgi:hypothetical protein